MNPTFLDFLLANADLVVGFTFLCLLAALVEVASAYLNDR